MAKSLKIMAGVAGVALMAASSASAADKSDTAPLSTPPGIILVDVMQFVNNSSAQFLWRRLGDANGKPLYTYNKDEQTGTSACTGDCAKEFPPLMAPAKAAAFGDWTLIPRPEGGKQWAYQGQPLYRYSGTDPAGEPRSGGGNGGATEDPSLFDGGSKLYSPKEGWKRAAYTPEKTIEMPAGVELKSSAVANGYAFVTPNLDMPMYVLKTPPKNPAVWTPVYAPVLAAPVGDFTISAREDGKRQWAYKGKLLYTYNEDYSPGDANGLLAQKDAEVALAYRHFQPAGVDINIYPVRGPVMTNSKGMALYTQTRYHLQYGGREMRGGYRYTYNDAKAVGVKGCTAQCTETWKPLIAPANARSRGFWEVATRLDGTKQWAYKGTPLYTYVGDKKPGDISGNNRHDIVYGDPEGKIDLSVTGGNNDAKYNEGSGFYWHLVSLYN